jgi:hypothetical protein
VAGAPFLFGEGEADGFGVALPSGVSLADGEASGDSPDDGLGVGDDLRFFFLLEAVGEDSGDGLGEDFFFFVDEAEGLGVGVSEGVGLTEGFFFFDDADFSGVAVGVGVADFSAVAIGFGVGDFSAVDFFFVCLRGVGVGVGAKIFLSLVPMDSSAGAWSAKPVTTARQARAANTVRAGRMEPDSSTSGRDLLKRLGPRARHPEPRRGRETSRLQSTSPKQPRTPF